MTDQELLNRVERAAFMEMLSCCDEDSFFDYVKFDLGSCVIPLRVETLCRLIDLAKRGLDDQ